MVQLLLAKLIGLQTAYAIVSDQAIKPASSSVGTGGLFDLGSDATATVNSLTSSAVDTIGLVAGALAIIYILWYGIQYILSGGVPDKTKVARQGIINGVIGIVIITAAYAVIRFAVAIGNKAASVI